MTAENGLSQLYQMQFHGRCLGSWLPHGAELTLDPEKHIEPGDVVGIVLKTDLADHWAELLNAGTPGAAAGLCKYYLGANDSPVGMVYIVGQLCPPAAALIPASIIEAMHLVVAAPCAGQMSEGDAFAMEFIRPFANGRGSPPIGPRPTAALSLHALARAAAPTRTPSMGFC